MDPQGPSNFFTGGQFSVPPPPISRPPIRFIHPAPFPPLPPPLPHWMHPPVKSAQEVKDFPPPRMIGHNNFGNVPGSTSANARQPIYDTAHVVTAPIKQYSHENFSRNTQNSFSSSMNMDVPIGKCNWQFTSVPPPPMPKHFQLQSRSAPCSNLPQLSNTHHSLQYNEYLQRNNWTSSSNSGIHHQKNNKEAVNFSESIGCPYDSSTVLSGPSINFVPNIGCSFQPSTLHSGRPASAIPNEFQLDSKRSTPGESTKHLHHGFHQPPVSTQAKTLQPPSELTTGCALLPSHWHPLHPGVVSHEKDQRWLNNWADEKLKQRASISNGLTRAKEISAISSTSDSNKLRLIDVHREVAQYKTLLAQLKAENSDPDKRVEAKGQLEKLSQKITDTAYHEQVRKLVNKCRKKRSRKKSRKKIVHEEWSRKSKEIDAKRALVISAEREKQKATRLQSDADAVLREVRHKQQEAWSLLSLTSALRDLRQHRLNKGEQQGHVDSEERQRCFHSVVGGLEEMVEAQLRQYELEERTLRAMLEQHSTGPKGEEEQDAKVKVEVSKETGNSSEGSGAQQLLVEALFGSAAPEDGALYSSYTAANTSDEMLLSRRRAWDLHVSSNEGTGVPLTWVTPPALPGPGWEKWLAKE